jgi:SAM-dependent methyltransferase
VFRETELADARRLFTDGKSYGQTMGRLSRIAGAAFLDWLSLPEGLRWLDVGCGGGAFTELVLERTAPGAVSAVDPSENQIAFARTRPSAARVAYEIGDALALPFDDDAFDAAVMALVIQHVPDPARAMEEMRRVVRQGGTVAAYVWPGRGAGHPLQPVYDAMGALGIAEPGRPGGQIRTLDGLVALYEAAGLEAVEGSGFDVTFAFDDFEDCWSAFPAPGLRHLSRDDAARVKSVLRERLPADAEGRVSYAAGVNAVRGRVPAEAAP